MDDIYYKKYIKYKNKYMENKYLKQHAGATKNMFSIIDKVVTLAANTANKIAINAEKQAIEAATQAEKAAKKAEKTKVAAKEAAKKAAYAINDL